MEKAVRRFCHDIVSNLNNIYSPLAWAHIQHAFVLLALACQSSISFCRDYFLIWISWFPVIYLLIILSGESDV